MEPHSDKQVECKSVAAGASAVSQIVLDPSGSDSEVNDQFNFDADSKGGSGEEMSTELAEPQVEREKTPTEPAEPEPEEEPQEELEPQFSPVESSSHSDSYESDSTASTSASSGTESDSGNESYTSVNHFDSDEEEVNPNNDYRKICLLQQTIKFDGHDVNILYDEGANVSTMSVKVAAPSLLKAVDICEIIAVERGGGVSLETCPLVEVPLPLFNGGVGVAQVRVTDREFPLMTADPPHGGYSGQAGFSSVFVCP
jgi:hypothetical protein